jgi:hypothetical protein
LKYDEEKKENVMVPNNGHEDALNMGYEPWNRYRVYDEDKGNEPGNGEIEGHHDIFDNQDLIMECLYGFYKPDEPWIRVELKPFLAAFN